MVTEATIEEDIYSFPDEAEEAYRKLNTDTEEKDDQPEALLPLVLSGVDVEGYETADNVGGDLISENKCGWLAVQTNADAIAWGYDAYKAGRVRKEIVVAFGCTTGQATIIAERTGSIVVSYEKHHLAEAATALDAACLQRLSEAGFEL